MIKRFKCREKKVDSHRWKLCKDTSLCHKVVPSSQVMTADGYERRILYFWSQQEAFKGNHWNLFKLSRGFSRIPPLSFYWRALLQGPSRHGAGTLHFWCWLSSSFLTGSTASDLRFFAKDDDASCILSIILRAEFHGAKNTKRWPVGRQSLSVFLLDAHTTSRPICVMKMDRLLAALWPFFVQPLDTQHNIPKEAAFVQFISHCQQQSSRRRSNWNAAC